MGIELNQIYRSSANSIGSPSAILAASLARCYNRSKLSVTEKIAQGDVAIGLQSTVNTNVVARKLLAVSPA
jgi:hypothetical protein